MTQDLDVTVVETPIRINEAAILHYTDLRFTRHDFTTGKNTACRATIAFGTRQVTDLGQTSPHDHVSLSVQCCGPEGHAGWHWADREQYDAPGSGLHLEAIATSRFNLTWENEG